MSGQRPQENCAPVGALFSLFWLIPAFAGIKKGIACAAAHASGRCPENLQAFEKA